MKNNMIETVLGAVVLLVAGVFVVFAYSNASLRTSTGYEVRARFDRVGDLKQGDDVKLAGIKVGSVTGQKLDPKTYQAVITLTIEPNVQLPTDTAAEVALAGLLGGSYVLLTPGGANASIQPGGEITVTQGAVNLIDLIGKAMFSSKDGLDKNDAGGKGTDAANPLLGPAPAPGAK
jgi:phospholipid/cholesterol/gamma-HCH transport system substrate-binding protein